MSDALRWPNPEDAEDVDKPKPRNFRSRDTLTDADVDRTSPEYLEKKAAYQKKVDAHNQKLIEARKEIMESMANTLFGTHSGTPLAKHPEATDPALTVWLRDEDAITDLVVECTYPPPLPAANRAPYACPPPPPPPPPAWCALAGRGHLCRLGYGSVMCAARLMCRVACCYTIAMMGPWQSAANAACSDVITGRHTVRRGWVHPPVGSIPPCVPSFSRREGPA